MVLPLTLCANLSNIGFQFWQLCLFTIVSSHFWMGASQIFCTLSNCSLKILGVLVDCFFTTTFVLPYKLMRTSMNMRTIWVDKSILKLLNPPIVVESLLSILEDSVTNGGFKRVKILSIMERLFKGLSILEGQKVWSCDWWNLNPKFPKWQ